MNVCIVGGIFDKDEHYREQVTSTPETVLVAELQRRGVQVATRGHWSTGDLSGFDVVHVHHIGPGAVAAASDPGSARFVYTNHASAHPSPLRAATFRMVAGRADYLVALSEAEARWQRRQAHPGTGIAVIPNGINDRVFQFAAPQPVRDGRAWRLLFVGQLIALKGVTHLLRAVGELQAELPIALGLAYHIDTDLPALREQVRAEGLADVRFLGRRSPEELAQCYAEADIVVLPSLTEALPSVISEAIMVGRPVVASAVGGIPSQVGEFGVTVPPGRPEAIASALRDVIARYDDFVAMAPRASAAAAARFSVSAMADAHLSLYEQLLRGSPARRHALRYALGSRLIRRVLAHPRMRGDPPVTGGR